MAPRFPPWRRPDPTPKLGLEVITKNIAQNPPCTHGPTICFEKFFIGGKSRKFYACSACRDQSSCPFFLWLDQRQSKEARLSWNKKIKESKPVRPHQDEYRRLSKLAAVSPEERGYCTVCNMLCLLPTDSAHAPTAECNTDTIITPVQDHHLKRPSQLVPLKVASKCEAQYLFTESAIETVLSLAQQAGAERVLCVGVPSVHERVMGTDPHDTMLLDIDARYRAFFPPTCFVRFNMFNQHFFDGDRARKRVLNYLKGQEKVCIICDPPFGARIELLDITFSYLTDLWREANDIDGDTPVDIPILLMLPYFLEHQVTENLPNFRMLDYQINYSNHENYTAGTKKAMKHGSAVRLYTNKPPSVFKLPAEEGYRHCEPCDRWVYAANSHCLKCKGCMGKDGSSYRHCDSCNKCVKPSWKHCEKCDRCQTQDHKCTGLPAGTFADAQKREIAHTCHVCGKSGHKRRDCPVRKSGAIESESKRKRVKSVAAKIGIKESAQYLNVINEILKK